MEKRIIIVDFNHMAHMFKYGGSGLSIRIMQNGEMVNVCTDIPNGAIKNIHRWSNKGRNPTVVCFDRKCTSRKEYFSRLIRKETGESETEKNRYKGGRGTMPNDMFTSIGLTESILENAGIRCLYEENYEADDIIMACVKKAKQDYPGLKIDIITNDADLVPLVDDTVSVFLRSKKYTYAEQKEIEKNKYAQVTPDNYQWLMEDLTAFKGFLVPYNTVLLHKMLRGDKSDNTPGYKGFTPTKYNNLVGQMLDAGEDLSIFRYDENVVGYDDGNGNEVTLAEAKEIKKNGGKPRKVFKEPLVVDEIRSLLRRYNVEESVIEHIGDVYNGMNLNTAYDMKGVEKRAPGVAPSFAGFSEVELQKEASKLRINLPLGR